MASRMLSGLEARIARTRDAQEKACLRAEKAALLARQGDLAGARSELAAVHSLYDSQPNAMVSAWVSFAEGLVAFNTDANVVARDKLLRALALSSAVRDTTVLPFSAAWLAHVEYLDQDFSHMAQHLSIAFLTAKPDADSALSRASLVTAQAYHWANRVDLAQVWYSRCRLHANKQGDETVLSALMHNMVWLRCAEARRMALSGAANNDYLREILLGADSTQHFDQRAGTVSLKSLVPILRAHVLSLLHRFSEALDLFEAFLPAAMSEGLARLQCSALAEIAWCRVNIDDSSGSLLIAEEAQLKTLECRQPDERAAAHGRLAQVYTAMKMAAPAKYHQEKSDLNWRLHETLQGELLHLLSTTPGIAGFR